MNNLLDWYMRGFKDELSGNSTIMSDNEIENTAYKLGAEHAIVGDDARYVDYLSDEEILNQINKLNKI